ncbi:MAG: transposase [Candidatus Omnitrophota bacterium]
MPRQVRIVIPNTPHHITQRGNYQQDIFDHEKHYKQYCKWIDDYAEHHDLEILAYCLMKNHVHFIVIPKEEHCLAKVFKIVHAMHAQYMNKQRKTKGHLWQGRFYSCVLDDAHLYRAIRYVENNPVRADLVKDAWEYKWSSASDHTGDRKKGLIRLGVYNTITPKDWHDYLKESDTDMTNEIKSKTNRGLVVGTNEFITYLEKRLNRSLQYLRQGRPTKR